ncbi:extracellular calcium-sensing receptor-like [Rhinatrema bivittatum]|uniref:extracellular calcium-sensing receptor-like n=1 Tax=Rhinatrema bivittatum TaxID=194408 RepID=UPI00112E2C13|nr:extracellular calcium-sensing receptor-like [Rhinatrema bivittatum]
MTSRSGAGGFFYWKVILWLLIFTLMPPSLSLGTEEGCQLRRPFEMGYSRPGDILIGGIFPLHENTVYHDTSFLLVPLGPAPITCHTFAFQNYQWMQSMVFAIEEINRDSNLLPNITLGFQVYDSCLIMQRALEGTLWMLTGKEKAVPNYRCQKSRLAAVVGDAGSFCSIPMARLLGASRYPQISYFSTSPLLSDRIQFPSFFRTVPSDAFQSLGLAQLVMHFGWSWVGFLAVSNDYGQQGVQMVKEEIVKAGACVAFSETILLNRADKNAVHITEVIKNSTANAIVVFSLDSELVPVLDEMVRQNVTGKIWIASEAWSTSSLLSQQKYAGILSGTIGFALHSGEMPGFKEFLISTHPARTPEDIFLREFWEEAFDCKWPEQEALLRSRDNRTKLCTGTEDLEGLQNLYTDVTNLRVTYNVYNTVYAIAYALQVLSSCQQGRGPFRRHTCADVANFQPWQLLHYIKNVHFHNKVGKEIFFDGDGNSPAQYDIVNWQRRAGGTIRHVKVGSYDSSAPPGQHLFINISAILWGSGDAQIPPSVCCPSCLPGFRKIVREGQPLCCFQCVLCPPGEISNQTDSAECSRCSWDYWPNARQDQCIPRTIEFLSYEEPLGTTLTGVSIVFSLIPVVSLGLFIHYRNTPIIKANNRSLSYLLLLALTLCFLCSLTFIGYPSPKKCLLRQAAFGISFALCISCVLVKTIMVVIAFKATKPSSVFRKWVGPQWSYIVISICTLIQVLVCVCWLFLSPPFSDYNIHTQPGKIIVECNEGSTIAFWCMLGYLGLLATISFIVAFLARKLPDSFNEAKFITFSMLAFLSVWLSFIPAYLSTHGKYMVAMEIFAILSSSSALLSCIFFPKCYIILVRPELNSKMNLLGRKRGHSKKKNGI